MDIGKDVVGRKNKERFTVGMFCFILRRLIESGGEKWDLVSVHNFADCSVQYLIFV